MKSHEGDDMKQNHTKVMQKNEMHEGGGLNHANMAMKGIVRS
jgi:hypothetical protein